MAKVVPVQLMGPWTARWQQKFATDSLLKKKGLWNYSTVKETNEISAKLWSATEDCWFKTADLNDLEQRLWHFSWSKGSVSHPHKLCRLKWPSWIATQGTHCSEFPICLFIKIYPSLIFLGFGPSSQMGRKCCTSLIVKLNHLQQAIHSAAFPSARRVCSSNASEQEQSPHRGSIQQSLLRAQPAANTTPALPQSLLSLPAGLCSNSRVTIKLISNITTTITPLTVLRDKDFTNLLAGLE